MERCVQIREDLAGEQPGNLHAQMAWLDALWHLVSTHMDAQRPHAALAPARKAAALLARYANNPPGNTGVRHQLGLWAISFSVALRKTGTPAEALSLGEHAVKIFQDLTRDDPKQLRHGWGLMNGWTGLGKARWEFGRAEEAMAAFREAVVVQRQVFEQAPSVNEYRHELSRCYDRLLHWSCLRGQWAEAAAALLEQEKLWPGDAERLLEVARDWEKLAAAVGQGQTEQSPPEQAERQRSIDESARVARSAAAVRQREKGAAASPKEGTKR